MKRILFASSLIVLFVGITSVAPPKKAKYTSAEAKLSVTFPAEFTVTESDDEDYRTVKVQGESDGAVYFVNYTVHNSKLSDYDGLMDVSIEAFAGGVGGEVTEQSDWKVGKKTGKKVLINVPEAGLKGDYRVIFVGQIQFQITSVAPVDSWNQKAVDDFMKSFKLKK